MKLIIKSSQDEIEFKLINFVKRFIKQDKTQFLFFSKIYNFWFNSPAEYWFELGKKETLITLITQQSKSGIKGFSLEELLSKVSISEFARGCGVILYNIDTTALGRILNRFENVKAAVFNEDFIFIPTSSRDHARKILSKIPLTLAFAVAVDNGLIFQKNEEDYFEGIRVS